MALGEIFGISDKDAKKKKRKLTGLKIKVSRSSQRGTFNIKTLKKAVKKD